MTRRTAISVLRQAFAALSKTQRERLRWHAKHGTHVCCGEDAIIYADGNGGG